MLAISKLPGKTFYALLLQFSCKRKYFEFDNHFHLKKINSQYQKEFTKLRKYNFPAFLEYINEEI